MKIYGIEYKFKVGFGGLILFEKLSHKPYSDIKDSLEDLLELTHCCLQSQNPEMYNLSFPEFLCAADDFTADTISLIRGEMEKFGERMSVDNSNKNKKKVPQ